MDTLQNIALDILEDCEVMQEFEDSLYIKVDKDLFNEYLNQLNYKDE